MTSDPTAIESGEAAERPVAPAAAREIPGADSPADAGLLDAPGRYEPHEVSRARAVIWINLLCVLVWIVINAVASVLLNNLHPLGVAGAGVAMAICWWWALRQIAAGEMESGVMTYTVSGLLLLLAMGLFVPEMAVLFTFATFIFLAFGLSYMDGRASLRVVALTLSVALVLLFTSLVLQFRSGVSQNVFRWVNLVGMLMALSIDATMFITLRRTLEARSRRMVAAERDAAAMQRRVAQQERLESLGKLAGGIAHDFNNLLGVIISYCGLISEAVEDRPAVREDVESVQSAAGRAAALTRQLLIFGRRQLSHGEVVDINQVLIAAEGLLRSATGEHITLTTTLEPGLPNVRIDTGHVEQILLNLSINARDAMPDGGLLLIQTAVREFPATEAEGLTPDPGRYVCISVTDTGSGFSDEAREHAFEPFFTTKPVGRGTGLGLATVHGIVTDAGGSIRLYSEAGVGTTVRVYLPIAEQPANPAVSEAAADLDGGGRTVLLVEDEPQLRLGTARVLARHNYRVLTVEQADQAVSVIENGEPISVLLTDVVMPGMSGLTLAEEAARLRPELRVLFMSGFPRDLWERGEVDRSLTLIEKPFDAAQLLRRLAELR
jgi:signal transduction histidine kinase